MIKNIKYNGYAAQPSDYESPDGQLAVSLNLIPEDGAVMALPQPAVRFSVGPGRHLFIHRIGAAFNYLSYSHDSPIIYWGSPEGQGELPLPLSIALPPDSGAIVSVAAVGYIVIVGTTTGIYYIRYDANKSKYIMLGSKIPDISLDLALKLNFVSSALTNSTKFEVATFDGDTTDNTSTSKDGAWALAVSKEYNVSKADGSLTDVPGGNEIVTTASIPFDPTFKILPGVEYKLRWERPGHIHELMTLRIYGYKNGATTPEKLKEITNSTASTHFIEALLMLNNENEEWSNLYFFIRFKHRSVSSVPCAANGKVSWFKGLSTSDSDPDVDNYIKYNEDSYNAIMGTVNKFVNEQGALKSRFIYPFFMRYAVRLYDGSYIHLSAPKLMVPNSGYVPAVAYSDSNSIGLGNRLILSAFAADIQYKVSNSIPEGWEDLIAGVDIFASQPIWAYNQGQEYDANVNYFRFKSAVNSFGCGRVFVGDAPDIDVTAYARVDLNKYIRRFAADSIAADYVQVAPRSVDDINKDVISVSNFYKVASIQLAQIKNVSSDFTDLEIEKDTLSALPVHLTLKDDVLPYVGFRNAYLKEYNKRLHVCHSSIILPPPAHPKECFNYLTDPEAENIRAFVFLATEDGAKMVRSYNPGSIHGPWFFYPDPRAYKAAFYFEDPETGNIQWYSAINLTRHDFLNGAYWYGGSLIGSLSEDEGAATDYPAPSAVSDSVRALSTIYVSEVNCPFVFKAVNAVGVGAQEVLAVSSAAKALSQGQFGQFPLYAFTSEGVWALSVSSTGQYTSVQPIVRDEAIDIESITQIDSAVLFASKRGIMRLAGSEVQCLSDILDTGATVFDAFALKGVDTMHSLIGHPPDSCINIDTFSNFIKQCRMIYDYPHQRIVIFNPSKLYAYVFSLKSQSWGMMFSNLKYTVNSYPDTLAVNLAGQVVDFSLVHDSVVKGLLITRPLKLDTPDVMKTVDTVIQRGHFLKGHVQSVLYGSRDLFNWHLVWSSKDHYLRGFRGTPYKYFRIACTTSLAPNESISGASVSFTPRLTVLLR